MDKRLKPVFILTVAAIICIAYSLAAWAISITNEHNRHNMSSNANDSHPHAKPPNEGGTDRICVFCHTPHTASPESTLWSRPDPETATFDLYAGRLAIKEIPETLYNSADASIQYPNGASRMCMSCHDGATAIGTVLGQATEIAMEQRFMPVGTIVDLSKSHPISFVWDSGIASDVNTWHSTRTTSVYTWPPNYNIAPLDGNSRMQCTTCHDPHDDPSRDINGNATGFMPFWRHDTGCTPSGTISDCYDNVCSQCHDGATPPITPPTGPVHNSAVLLP